MPIQSLPSLPAPAGIGTAPSSMAEAKTSDYSQTNIQVQGVDEADLVKTDGQSAYHLTKNRLAISRVSPPDQAKLDSLTEFGERFQAQDLYLDGNRLMVIGTIWEPQVYPMPLSARSSPSTTVWSNGRTLSVVQIWNVADRAHPKKERTIEFDGIVSASRLLDHRVYLVMNAQSAWNGVSLYRSSIDLVPAYRDSQTGN